MFHKGVPTPSLLQNPRIYFWGGIKFSKCLANVGLQFHLSFMVPLDPKLHNLHVYSTTASKSMIST